MIGSPTARRIRRVSGSTSSTWFLKKVFATMLVVGAFSSVTMGTTFALFNSQDGNGLSSVATGTLTLSNKVNTGTACLSYNGPASPGNVNNACTALFTSGTLAYPGTASTVNITILNNGTLNSSDLSVYMPSCTNITSPGVTTPGGGDPCAVGGAQFSIAEATSSAFTPSTAACKFPTPSSTPCIATADSLHTFAAGYFDAPGAFDLGTGPAAGAARYFIVSMQLPATASNTLQGQAAQFGLTWHITS
jgi:hypothetical protein